MAPALVGCEAQPTDLQLAFHLLAVLVIVSGSRWGREVQARRRTAVTARVPGSA
ncbi:hypothetical protein [Polaromonas jejuensis]|uniref:hypothetical protein n=1 Tax=Polaromonas jejuensis TaxID=457502 RepID=UPI0012EE6B5F|nr:hypothetical protein [Polaromonas jejuensis]